MPKEIIRVRMKLQIPPPGLGSTFQMRSRAVWSCTKTPVAPNRIVTRPRTVASTPEPCLPALAIIVWIACRALVPTMPLHLAHELPLDRLAPPDQAGDGDHDQQQRREREDRVVGERRPEIEGAVVFPPLKAFFDQIESGLDDTHATTSW